MPTDNDRKRLRALASAVDSAENKGGGWWVVNACHLATGVLSLLDQLEAVERERDEWQRTSEQWRRAHFAWQDWGERMRKIVGGTLNGDEPTRSAIEARAIKWRDGRDAAQLRAIRAESERDKLIREQDAALAASQQEVERLRRVIEDAAPMMMTVTAFGADEADKHGLAEMARWYAEQERDYSSFDVWLDAHRDREKRNKEGGVEP